MNEVYYKVYLNSDDLVTIVCMQDFDEYDYVQDRFYKDGNDIAYKFEYECQAKDFVNKKFKKESIDPEYRNSENLFEDKLK